MKKLYIKSFNTNNLFCLFFVQIQIACQESGHNYPDFLDAAHSMLEWDSDRRTHKHCQKALMIKIIYTQGKQDTILKRAMNLTILQSAVSITSLAILSMHDNTG